MATEGNGDPPVLDLRTRDELFQPTLNGRGGPIAPIAIQATNFGLKNDMIQQVQNSCQLHRLPGDDANKHLDKFLHVTQNIKVNGVTDDALRLYLFPHSLTHHATAWFDRLPRNSINTFEQMEKIFLGKYFPPSMGDPSVPDLLTIEELCQPTLNDRGGPIAPIAIQATNFELKNDMIQQVQNSCQFQGLPDDDVNKHLDKFLHVTQSIKVNGVTDDALRLYLFSHSLTHHATAWFDRLPRNSINTFEQMAKMFLGNTFHLPWSESSSSIVSSFDLEIVALKAKMVEINKNLMKLPLAKLKTYMMREPIIKVVILTNLKENNQGRNQFFQGASHGQNPPSAYQAVGYQAPVHQAPIPQPQVVTTTEFTNYMKANDAILKNMQTNMTSFTNSNLELKNMFGQFMKMNTASSSSSGTLLSNTITNPKEDLKVITTQSGSAYKGPTTPTTSSLPKVVKHHSISCPVEVAEDVFVKVGMFHFPADFVVVDFDVDPRFLLILERSLLKTERALIDVYEGELTHRVGKEAVTFNLDQTSRYSANYDVMSVNRIDLIDVACEEYSQEVLGFSVSGNPTPSTEPIVFNSSPTLTPFGDSDFLLEETDAFLAIDDVPISPEIDDQLKVVEPTNKKSSIDEPPVVKLKDLPSHLEYAFLKGDDKLPVIIAKDLKDEEKTALIKVLKSHKQALAWQLFDIKGIALEFYTHKILMEDDFKPAIQHKRRVNPKIHEVIKKEVLKFLDAILIYPISDSPWSSGGVFTTRKPLIFSRLATMDSPGDITARTTLSKRMKCLKIPSKFTRFLTFGASISCGHFHLHEGTIPTNDARVVCKILNSLFARFGTPRAIISDRGTYFGIDQFAKVMLKYGVTHRLAITYHPQTSGQVKVFNHGLKRILKRTVGENRTSWSNKLDDALWAFRAAFKTPIGCTPYKLVYRKACHLPIELKHKSYWALKHCNYDLLTTGDHQKVQLNELNELRDQANENFLIYKEKTKRIHDSKIKDRVFNVGDRSSSLILD
nr:reverse transcriptase domain-containing protein [Tanacetum cinerariifolium]